VYSENRLQIKRPAQHIFIKIVQIRILINTFIMRIVHPKCFARRPARVVFPDPIFPAIAICIIHVFEFIKVLKNRKITSQKRGAYNSRSISILKNPVYFFYIITVI
jgi:hypothetical protein